MIPEPNLWADLRERDRGLDEVEYPPHHLEVAPSNTRFVEEFSQFDFLFKSLN